MAFVVVGRNTPIGEIRESKPRLGVFHGSSQISVGDTESIPDGLSLNNVNRNIERHLASGEKTVATKRKRNLKCLQCDRFIKSPLRLCAHKLRVHKRLLISLYCGKRFPCERRLSIHKRVHGRRKTLIKRSKYRLDIAQQNRRETNDEEVPQNAQSGTNFKTDPISESGLKVETHGMDDHFIRHEEKQLECYYCPKNFDNYDKITAHELNEHVKANQVTAHEWTQHVKDNQVTAHEWNAHVKVEHVTAYELNKQVKANQVMAHELNTHVKAEHDTAHELNKHGKDNQVTAHKSNQHIKADQATAHEVSEHVKGNQVLAHEWNQHAKAEPKAEGVTYNCKFCANSFHNKNELDAHTQSEHVGKINQCDTCKKSYPVTQKTHDCIELKVDQTSQQSRNMVDNFHCEVCSEIFQSKFSLTEHIEIKHDGKAFQCDFCRKAFLTKWSLVCHTKSAHKDGVRRFSCDLCPKDFSALNSLQHHYKIEHQGKTFDCKVCGKTFRSRYALTHSRQCKLNECDKCKKSYPSSEIHFCTEQTGSQFTCRLCGVIFQLQSSLKTHIRNSHKGKFFCEICVLIFQSKVSLTDHIEIVHEGKAHRCGLCEKNFRDKRRLQGHKQKVHGKEGEILVEPRICKYCNKSFCSESALDYHIQVVHESKRYRCNTCNKTCARISSTPSCESCYKNLPTRQTPLKHTENSHGSKAPKLYCCIICDINYQSQAELQNHVKITHTAAYRGSFDAIMRKCGCKSSRCLSNGCSCKKNGNACSSLCSCLNCENNVQTEKNKHSTATS